MADSLLDKDNTTAEIRPFRIEIPRPNSMICKSAWLALAGPMSCQGSAGAAVCRLTTLRSSPTIGPTSTSCSTFTNKAGLRFRALLHESGVQSTKLSRL
jgi:hypothetical protein